MNKKEILESGMLERYLLGELSPEEKSQLELLLFADADLKAQFQQLESSFEQMAQENAITPPSMVKQSLLHEIESENPVKALDDSHSLKQYLAIAAALVVLFGVGSFWMYSNLNTMEESLRLVQDENIELKNNVLDMQEDLAATNNWYHAINDPNAIKLVLQGNEKSPQALAVSYLNHKNKTVVLNAAGLPKLADAHDYQLWADVNGEMIDMGVIPKDTQMIAMNYIENAESLNITIEPAGGNDHPTVERLISNVYLN